MISLYPFHFDVIKEFSRINDNVKFIQIGSNDGITKDPIHEFIKTNNWEGIMVEPVPYLFEKLKNTYKDCNNRLSFENSAISEKSGKIDFFRLRQTKLPNIPWWCDQIGSLKKEIVLRHRGLLPEFDELFIKDTVNAINFNGLLAKYSITKVDFILIDTEGYDYEIIKTIPFNKLHVKLLMYEHKHLNKSDYKESILLLRKHGFVVGPLIKNALVKDTIAINENTLDLIINNMMK